MNIVGHAKVLSFFDTVMAEDRLHHAYCLVGPDSVGKRTVALYLSSKLLGLPVERIATHPDLMMIGQTVNEKTGKTKKDIDIDQLRALRSFLFQRPFLGKWKVGLIDEAEKMNDHAANALLKTLEEPRSHSMLWLTTHDEELLPETVRSRCHMIYFSLVPRNLMRELAVEQNIPEKRKEDMIRLANGRPGRFWQWLSDEAAFTAYKQWEDMFAALVGASFHQKLRQVEPFWKDTSDHIAARSRLQECLSVWQMLAREYCQSYPNKQTTTVRYAWSAPEYLRVSESIQRARDLLQRNIHPRLLIEHILISIP